MSQPIVIVVFGWLCSGVSGFLFLTGFLGLRTLDRSYRFLFLILGWSSLILMHHGLLVSGWMSNTPMLYFPGRVNYAPLHLSLLLFIGSTHPYPGQSWKFIWWMLQLVLLGVLMFQLFRWLGIPIAIKEDMLVLFYENLRRNPFDYYVAGFQLVKHIFIPSVILFTATLALIRLDSLLPNTTRRSARLLWLILLMSTLHVLLGPYLYRMVYSLTKWNYTEWLVDIIFIGMQVLVVGGMLMLAFVGKPWVPPLKQKPSKTNYLRNKVLYGKLDALVNQEKLYLDPEMDLNHLSKQLKVNTKYLSQAINQEYGDTFVRYINHLRIDAARTYLNDSNNDHLTLAAIGEMSGFRSKSAFYQAFKYHTGQTPASYYKQISLDS